MVKITVKILADIPGYKKGQEITIAIDKDGTPLERFWRRRFKDAEIDNCLEIQKVMEKASKIAKSKQQPEKTK